MALVIAKLGVSLTPLVPRTSISRCPSMFFAAERPILPRAKQLVTCKSKRQVLSVIKLPSNPLRHLWLQPAYQVLF